jgi:hypothetical protein
MADTGKPDDGPSLEMPSFSLRRKQKPPVEDEELPQEPPVKDEELRQEEHEEHEELPQERRELPRVALAGLPAAAVTGLLVGGLSLLVAWLAAAGCDAVRGTSACGGAAGVPILLVGLVLLAWAGGLLLRAFGVAESGSTSILAVGVLAVLVMLFLLGSIDEWWTAIAIPLLAMVSYAGSWWVTTAVADEESRTPESYDVH